MIRFHLIKKIGIYSFRGEHVSNIKDIHMTYHITFRTTEITKAYKKNLRTKKEHKYLRAYGPGKKVTVRW